MAKKDFETGLDSLFAKRERKQPTPQPKEKESLSANRMEGRGDILSTIEDEELRALLRAKRMEGRGRPRKNELRESLTDGYTRATMIVSESKYNRLKELSLEQTKTIKQIVEEAFDLLIEKYSTNP